MGARKWPLQHQLTARNERHFSPLRGRRSKALRTVREGP